MIVNRQIGGSGGATASILISGLASTDTVSATTPSSKTITPTWKNSKWCFEKLIEYGTYTITASNGTKTATQNVLIDVATEYDVEMGYRTYLYNYGDECEDVTGGWGISGYTYSGYTVTQGTKNTDNLYTHASSGVINQFGTLNTLDLTEYNKLYFDCVTSGQNTDPLDMYVLSNKTTWESYIVRGMYASNTTRAVVEMDISDIFDYRYILIDSASISTRSANVYRIWLE